MANIPAQVESLLDSLEKAVHGIDKTHYMCLNQNQKGDRSTRKSGSLKLVDKFTYLRSSVSSKEKDINTRLAKAWATLDTLSVISKSDLSNKIKCDFSKQQLRHYYYMDAPD